MCTGIRLIAQNNAVIYARTLEFGVDIASNILYIPKNYAFTATAPSGKAQGLHWKSKYAVVGANAFELVGIIDGVNEQGLAGGLFYFPEYAEFQEVLQDQIQQSLAPWELMTWILMNFATVAEVQEALPTIFVSKTVFASWGIIPPVHAIVHDAQGNSLVIEYIHGKLHMHANSLGVFTNDPAFDWHMTNLNNYLYLSALNVEQRTVHDIPLKPLGQGSGMLGLPGDFTSPSRFIRAVACSQSLVDLYTEDHARDAAFHVLNLFDIPKGVVREKEKGHIFYDYTQWTSLSDLKNKRYYWHTYDNRQIRMIDLTKYIALQKPVTISLHDQQNILEKMPQEA